jgi:hypothetical protein
MRLWIASSFAIGKLPGQLASHGSTRTRRADLIHWGSIGLKVPSFIL